MAVIMTGRVLLVCALCVLWCGSSRIAASGVYASGVEDGARGGCMVSGVLGTNWSYTPSGCNKTVPMTALRSVFSVVAAEASTEQEDSETDTVLDSPSGDGPDSGLGSPVGSGAVDGSKVIDGELGNSAVVPPDTRVAVASPPPSAPETDASRLPEVTSSTKKHNSSEKLVHLKTKTPAGTPPLSNQASKESLPTVKPESPTTSDSTVTVKGTDQISEEKLAVLQGPSTVNAGEDGKKAVTEIKPNTTTNTPDAAPTLSSEGDVTEQHGKDTDSSNFMNNANTGSSAETTASSFSKSGGIDAPKNESEDEGDAQRPNSKEPQEKPEDSNTNDALTENETAPQTEKPFGSAQTNDTSKSGDNDGSTAVSHAISPLLLLLLVVACAAVAAVVVA
ncbi:mucin-associated surface protein (MASP), putative [Trypanosoma cruzi]|uniref:Mucin-associated surface protein (MASP), putative n=1 Tax=Trypanosoma cruzi (strain CL Brener) TaxID=353153 RepID=Q4CYI8_TRYCC|nr:mucin-associated surface protein (MASP), putative [Trypanosoma cruzi]EAN85337.1 mucin-associated surface protein (MASP), putative [Trypanosoma cruzi]|eukprot:XP_807188.1 mucin-associated surface protein (MASP) [Trypanosoma cruzi strain CL Brener]